jgi:hypothetical protein
LWSGSSGAGGGPVFIDALSDEERIDATKALLAQVFDYVRTRKFSDAVVYTRPGDDVGVTISGVGEAIKTTPVISFPKGETWADFRAKLPKDTRYDLRRAEACEVILAEVKDDLEVYRRMQEEFINARALPHSRLNSLDDMYRAWDILSNGNAKLYLALMADECVGGAILLKSGDKLFYHSGVATADGKGHNASEALQSRIIVDAIGDGIRSYNLVGAPDTESPLYGITAFKMKFGAHLVNFKRYSWHSSSVYSRLTKKVSTTWGRVSEPPILFYP